MGSKNTHPSAFQHTHATTPWYCLYNAEQNSDGLSPVELIVRGGTTTTAKVSKHGNLLQIVLDAMKSKRDYWEM